MKKEANNSAKQLKKVVSIISIVTVSVAALIGILLLIVKELIAVPVIGDILLTLLTLFACGILLLNAVPAIERRNNLGYVSIVLLGLSGLAFLILIWFKLGTIFLDITLLLSSFSIFFAVLINRILVLRKKLLPLQIIGYVTLLVILVYVNEFIMGGKALLPLTVIIIDAIVCIVMFIVLSLASKNISSKSEEKTITIPLDEYNALKQEIAELRKQLRK